jgi:hypothetical protein
VHFEIAQAPDFKICLRAAQWLTGDQARREQYEWADIPAELVEQWTREYQGGREPASDPGAEGPIEPPPPAA